MIELRRRRWTGDRASDDFAATSARDDGADSGEAQVRLEIARFTADARHHGLSRRHLQNVIEHALLFGERGDAEAAIRLLRIYRSIFPQYAEHAEAARNALLGIAGATKPAGRKR